MQGEQAVVSPRYPPAVHEPRAVIVQVVPDPQHAPTHGLGEQVVPAPLNCPLHALDTVTPQMTPFVQHAPISALQAAVGQVVASPRKVPPLVQALGARTSQTDPWLQHAPAHGFGLHVVPAPLNVPTQVLETLGPQLPDVPVQHAPMSAVQAAAGQVVPSP